MWMKYCKDFDHYTSLILAQHPFMCIIMHSAVIIQTICKDFIKSSSYAMPPANFFCFCLRYRRFLYIIIICSQRGRQSKSQRALCIKSQHACPPPGASSEKRIKKQSFSILFISSYSGCSVPPPGRDNVLPPSQSLASLFLS